MLLAAVGAPKPRKRRGRAVTSDTPSTFNVNTSPNTDSVTTSRLQVLSDRYAVRGRLALAISLAFWGDTEVDRG